MATKVNKENLITDEAKLKAQEALEKAEAEKKAGNDEDNASESKEVQEDPRVSAMLEQLQKAITETNARNESMAAKEKEMDEKMSQMKPLAELPAAERVHVEKLHASKAARMKEHLSKQDKVKIFVPLDGKEKKGTQLPVTLNGYRLNVPKGIYVEVPQQVAEVIMESLNQTQAATDIPQNLDNMDDDRRKIFS